MKQDAHDSSLPTKVNDILGFGIIAWEVRAGSFIQRRSVRSLEIGVHGTASVL